MNKKLLKIFGIVLGIATIVLAVIVFSKGVGYYEGSETYGGDAYTGIQNAAAQAANNIKYVGEMLRFALGSQMLVMGLAMLLGSLCIRTKEPAKVSAPVQVAPVPYTHAPANTVSHKLTAPVVPPVAPPVPAAPREWRCARCGTANGAEGRFCHVCGTPKR